ncbi:MAG TPA: PTS sugar transporter subunit IIA [Enterococcus casseliflavus]|nr:PTS sugar transporter subunit IIA [Enterococcus casseliflavus]
MFLFAVPANQEGVTIHLKLLSQVAAKLADESTLKQLKDEDDVERFIKILSR